MNRFLFLLPSLRSCLHQGGLMNMQCGHLSAGLGYYVRDSGLLDVLRRSDKRARTHAS